MKGEIIKKPKCPKCGNRMQPYNAMLPKDFICLVCLFSTKSDIPVTSMKKTRERCCPEE